MATGRPDIANSYLAILWRRRIPVAIVIAVGFAVSFEVLHKTQYQATATVMEVGQQVDSTQSASTDLPTLLLSSSVAGQVRRTMNLPQSPEDFLHAIDAKGSPGSSVLAITYHDEDRARAVGTANALADRMSSYYREMGFARLDQLDGYLREKMSLQERDIADIDRELAENVVAHPGDVGKDMVTAAASRMVDLQSQRDQLEIKVRGDDARASELAQSLSRSSETVRYELQQADPQLRSLEEHVANDTAGAIPLITQYRPDYPGVKSIKTQLRREQEMVASRRSALNGLPAGASTSYRQAESSYSDAAAAKSADDAQLKALDSRIVAARQEMRVLPKLNYHANTLETRRNADNLAYQALATKRSDVTGDLAENSSVGSVVVVDRAVTADASLIGGHAVRIAGAMVSVLILAIGLAFLLEALDSRMR
ncbi:MAG: hypothetical protein IAI50_06565, partial [Candidatus Eremiobacteraeota bacterium]|nr:hypothetical protein [Candidatus Eremiobacteraeota bacterium]